MAFDKTLWQEELRQLLGQGAQSMIELEERENKYDPRLHRDRLERILNNWDQLMEIMDRELPSTAELEPCCPQQFGDRFRGQVRIPTLYELLELVKQKRPDLMLGVEIKEYTEETVDITVRALKEYGLFENCQFYAFNGRIIRYLKQRYVL